MMEQSRHRSVETLRGYVREAEIFKEHAGAGLLWAGDQSDYRQMLSRRGGEGGAIEH
jgi:hypothetical protein